MDKDEEEMGRQIGAPFQTAAALDRKDTVSLAGHDVKVAAVGRTSVAAAAA
jgi:hypothetical protein